VSGTQRAPAASGVRAFMTLRVLETATLLAMLAGIGLFAYSLVDIVRIETQAGATNIAGARREIPPTAYPGLALFFGGMLALQGVRVVLHRYRSDDGSARADARGAATASTTASPASERPGEGGDAPRSDARPLYSEDGPAFAPDDDIREA
jgi:hypothetical protein